MEKYLNIVHYILYKGFCWIFLHTLKINPLFYLYKIPLIRKRLMKQGIDPDQELYKTFPEISGGFCITYAGGTIIGIIGFYLLGITNIVFMIFSIKINWFIGVFLFVTFIILPLRIEHIFISKDDRYIKYIRTFEKASKSWKIKWVWITAGILIASIFFAFGSLVWYIKLVML